MRANRHSQLYFVLFVLALPMILMVAGCGRGGCSSSGNGPGAGTGPGTPPNNGPQAPAAVGDIIAQSVVFTPDGGQGPANQVNVGTAGTVTATIANTFNQDVTGRLLVTGNGATLIDNPAMTLQANSQIPATANTTLNQAGPYNLVATITPAAGTPAEDPGNNTATGNVVVVGPGGQQVQGDIIAQSVVFVPAGGNQPPATQANVGTAGTVVAAIANTFSQDVTFRLLVTGKGATLIDNPTTTLRANSQDVAMANTTLNQAGPYNIVATITPAAGMPPEDPGTNTATATVNVIAPPPPPPPAGDIIAVKLRFIEYPEAILTDHTTVGHKGSLGFWAKNTFANPVDIYLNMTDGPITIYDGPLNNLRPGEYVYQFDYKFTTAGQHNVVANIRLVNPQVAEDPNTNTANCPVLVGDHVPPTATPAGSNLPVGTVVTTGPTSGVMTTNPTHPWQVAPRCDLEVTIPELWAADHHVSNLAYPGESGVIKFNASNLSDQDAPPVTVKLVVTNPDGSNFMDEHQTVTLRANTTLPLAITTPPVRQLKAYKMEVEIDNKQPYVVNDFNRPNNYSHHGFTVMPPDTEQTSSHLEEKMLKRGGPDAHATDIGFIPNGANDYLDEVYQGEKGSLCGVYENNSDADIKNLKVQILVDGQVIRESVKKLIKARESVSFKFSNYWFNALGRHKVSLIVDPDNQIKELDEKNNSIGHTINVIARPRPRTTTYDNSGAAAISGLLGGALGGGKSTGGSGSVPSVYTPPATTYTSPAVDQGGSSSGTATKKATPTFTTKGLGR